MPQKLEYRQEHPHNPAADRLLVEAATRTSTSHRYRTSTPAGSGRRPDRGLVVLDRPLVLDILPLPGSAEGTHEVLAIAQPPWIRSAAGFLLTRAPAFLSASSGYRSCHSWSPRPRCTGRVLEPLVLEELAGSGLQGAVVERPSAFDDILWSRPGG